MAGCCARIAEVARCILPAEPRPLAAHSKRKPGLITRDAISVFTHLRTQEIMLTSAIMLQCVPT